MTTLLCGLLACQAIFAPRLGRRPRLRGPGVVCDWMFLTPDGQVARAGQVQVRDGGCHFGNLVGLGIDFPLRTDPPGADGEDRQQVNLAAVAADRAADSLAIRGCLLHLGGEAWPVSFGRWAAGRGP